MELWHFCILLTYLFAGFAHSLSSKKWLQGTLGKSLLLPADIPQGFQVREASWRFLSTTEDILASFFKGTVEMMYKSRFLNRTHLHENFSLQISDLRIEDSGDFELRLVNSEGGKRTQDFAITVYEAVSKPRIHLYSMGNDMPSCSSQWNIFLVCSVMHGSHTAFTWKKGAIAIPNNNEVSILDEGRILHTSLGPQDVNVSYSCTVANAISNDTETIIPRKTNDCKLESRKRHENVNYCFLLSIILPACVVILCALATILLSNKKCRDNKNSKPIDDDCALPSLREVESLHEDGNLVPSASLSDSFELREDELCQNN
ncbi:SLAM family member 8-like isoform X1 [Protopterus annectens]|uniref:SLAM family member 8-like isoform X1 n=1 Tax=Protopterus annectens TaxID=7888 RepID=UPI001CFBB78E|nr:SLAM family member 8-like isoform X1 [Protopterus annectens]